MTTNSRKFNVFAGDLATADWVLPQGQVSVRLLKGPTKETENEDSAAILSVDEDTLVLAVADGVGGAPGGHDASVLAIRSLTELSRDQAGGEVTLRPVIIDSIERANLEIMRLGRGSGTTIAVAEIVAGALRSYHVGDSEVVVIGQRGKLKQRVVPHSPTGFAVEAGLLDEDIAVHHEARHILLNVVGSPGMRIEVGMPLRLQPKDTVILASDGLFDNLYFNEIVNIARCGPLAEAADTLVQRVRKRMLDGSDPKMPSKPDDLAIILYRQLPAKS